MTFRRTSHVLISLMFAISSQLVEGTSPSRTSCHRRTRDSPSANIVTAAKQGGNLHNGIRGGGEAAVPPISSTSIVKRQTLNILHQTSFLMVASTSMVVFAPLPLLTRYYADLMSSTSSSAQPQARAIQILSILSSISASIELFLSPLVGVMIDKIGRKLPMILFTIFITITNLLVVIYPSITSICLSRMINVLVGGFVVIIANAIIADTSTDESNEMMGSTLGRQAATVSLGFLFGSLAGGRLTEYGERMAYIAALLFSIVATLNTLRIHDSIQFTNIKKGTGGDNTQDDDVGQTLRKKLVGAPLSAIALLYQYGSRMRTLALLLMLQSIPVFMGDVFQMFAKEHWGLNPKDFANIIALFGTLGIISNISLPPVLKALGLRNFSLFAILSSLLFPLTTLLTSSYHYVLLAGCLGLFGGVQKIGTSSAMISLASELDIPQGELQGSKASMLALCKITSPIVYGWLYLKGKSWDTSSSVISKDTAVLEIIMNKIGSKLPFVLNVILGLCALAITWVSMG